MSSKNGIHLRSLQVFGSEDIHPTAVVSPKATLGKGVKIGAYSVVGEQVKLGDGCILHHHVSVQGPSTFGKENVFHPFCSVGSKTQDLKYVGEPTLLVVGDQNEFREFSTVNRGTGKKEKTVIGSHNLFLAYTHVAHNCVVGDHCILSNNGTLGGHVTLGDHVIIGGFGAIHQFCRIGDHAMVGGCSKIVQDVPPYFIADGNPAVVRTVNAVGLQRRGFSETQVRRLRRALRILYDDSMNTSQALVELDSALGKHKEIQHLIEFTRQSDRGIIR